MVSYLSKALIQLVHGTQLTQRYVALIHRLLSMLNLVSMFHLNRMCCNQTHGLLRLVQHFVQMVHQLVVVMQIQYMLHLHQNRLLSAQP